MRSSLALLGRRCRHAEPDDLREPFASPERLTDSWSWPHSSGAGRCRLRRGPGTIRSRCPPGPPGRAGRPWRPSGRRTSAGSSRTPARLGCTGRPAPRPTGAGQPRPAAPLVGHQPQVTGRAVHRLAGGERLIHGGHGVHRAQPHSTPDGLLQPGHRDRFDPGNVGVVDDGDRDRAHSPPGHEFRQRPRVRGSPSHARAAAAAPTGVSRAGGSPVSCPTEILRSRNAAQVADRISGSADAA